MFEIPTRQPTKGFMQYLKLLKDERLYFDDKPEMVILGSILIKKYPVLPGQSLSSIQESKRVEGDYQNQKGTRVRRRKEERNKIQLYSIGASWFSSISTKDEEQSSRNHESLYASASKQYPALTSTGWQITDTRDAVVDSLMPRSDTESEHSEQSSDDIPMQDEGHVSDTGRDFGYAHIPMCHAPLRGFKPKFFAKGEGE
ncbi:hypothetical protein Tco_1072464 [Tanacetum coccineum]